jgi:hypothetical protein
VAAGDRPARAPVNVLRGTGSPGGTRTVSVCSSRAGIARRPASVMSIQTTPVAEPGTMVSGSAGEAMSVIAARSFAPPKAATRRPARASRTTTRVTVTGTLKPLTIWSS